MTKSLTLKQALFVKAYLGEARGNGVKAARFAGYRGNEATLRAIASENLTKPNIAAEVSRRVSKILEPDEVLTELCMIAEAQITERIKTTEKLKALELVR
jgi:phage terminase small subunit